MASLREILVTFGVEFDTAPLEHGESKIEGLFGKIKELGKLLAEAFVVKEIAEFTLHAAEQAEALEHTAQATGLSTQELQAWQLGASEAGVEGEGFTLALRRLSVAIAGGKDEAGSAGDIFAKLKIKTKDAAGQTRGLGDILPEIAEHFKNTADGAGKAALAQQIFGRQGSRLIPILNKGAEGIVELKKDLDDLGGGFSPEFIEESAKVIEQTKRLDVAWTSAKTKVLGFFLPGLEYAVRGLIKLSQRFQDLAKYTNIVQAALGVLAAFAAAKAAVLVATWWPVIAPFLAWAAAVALVVLVVDDLITAWEGGDSAIGRILDRIWGPGATRKVVAWCRETLSAFGTFFDDLQNHPVEFEQTWDRTVENIKHDIDGLGPVLGPIVNAWLSIWGTMIDALTGGWDNFLAKTSAVWDGIGLAFQIAWTEIKFFGLGVVAELSDAVDGLLKKIPGGLADKLGLAGTGTAGADLDALHNKAKLDLAARGDSIGARLAAPSSSAGGTHTVMVAPVTNVNVAPGTPAQQARALGVAAGVGAAKGGHAAGKAHAGVPLKNPNRAGQAALGRP